MKYSIAAISAFVALVAAKPAFLNSAFDVEEGKPFELKFSGCEGGCTIVLQNGESDNTKDVETLTSSAEGASFSFTPKGLPSDTYNFKITNNESGEENFSSQFEYKGTGSLPTTGTTSAASSTGSVVTSSSSAVYTVSSTLSLTTVTTAVTTETSASTTVVSTSSIIESVTKNATITHATSATKPAASTSTAEASATTAAPTTSATTVPDSGATRMTSSLALVAGAIMAMIYLN